MATTRPLDAFTVKGGQNDPIERQCIRKQRVNRRWHSREWIAFQDSWRRHRPPSLSVAAPYRDNYRAPAADIAEVVSSTQGGNSRIITHNKIIGRASTAPAANIPSRPRMVG
jgi:hypothetical protein